MTAALFTALSALVVAPAFAQEGEEPAASPPELLAVDASDESYVLVRSAERPGTVEVAVNGVPAGVSNPIPLERSSLGAETILVIDNGVRAEGLLDEFVSAATDYVRRASDRERIGVYTTGGGATLRIGVSNNHDRTIDALAGIVPSNDESKLWDGLRGAALDLRGGAAGRTNIIIFVGSGDGGSLSSVASSRGAVLAANASAFVVAHQRDEVPLDALGNIASVSLGGAMAATTDESLIAAYGASVSDLIGGTYVIPFRIDDLTGGQSLTVVIDGTRMDASYIAGTVTSGPSLAPFIDSGTGGLPFLKGETAKTLGLVFGAIAAALGAWAVAAMFQKDPSGLNSVLEAYADPYGSAAPEESDEDSGFAKNLLLKRAVEITESFAERQGFLVRTENSLERADLPLRAGEALTVYAGVILVAFVAGLLLGGTLIAALILGAIGTMAPPAIVNFLAGRRKKAFLSQLPDTLQLLSSTLKAGYSFMQGVEAVSQEVDDPMGNELRRVVTEAQLGRPVEESLDASAERMDSPDFAWAVMAVRIQREVGGNLSELLLTVAETMTARERLRRDVAALTAEGKMSAIVLGALPILLGFAMYVMNPEYIGTLFEESIGKILLVVSMVSVLIGFAWMKKIIDIDI